MSTNRKQEILEKRLKGNIMSSLKGFIDTCETDSVSRVIFTMNGYTLKTPVDSSYTTMIRNAYRCGDMVEIQYKEGKKNDFMTSGSVVGCEKVYLHWYNNFLTYEGFASFYDITEEAARKVIIRGRTKHNLKHEVKA